MNEHVLVLLNPLTQLHKSISLRAYAIPTKTTIEWINAQTKKNYLNLTTVPD